jgi:predicted amidophosphoribosyltransferase
VFSIENPYAAVAFYFTFVLQVKTDRNLPAHLPLCPEFRYNRKTDWETCQNCWKKERTMALGTYLEKAGNAIFVKYFTLYEKESPRQRLSKKFKKTTILPKARLSQKYLSDARFLRNASKKMRLKPLSNLDGLRRQPSQKPPSCLRG